jgi:hypothetical protein
VQVGPGTRQTLDIHPISQHPEARPIQPPHSGGESLPPLSWLGELIVVTAMFVAEIGARRCRDAKSPRVEWF